MRLMLASAIILTSAALTAIASAGPATAEERKYDLSGFTKIEASKGFRVEFTQSPTWAVTVDSRHNNLDMITVEKVGDTLRISRPADFCSIRISKDGVTKRMGNGPSDRCLDHDVEDIVYVSAPDLKALKLNAAIQFTAGKLVADNLAIDADAAISVKIADLRVNTLNVDMDAASKLVVAGTCAKLLLDLGAASEVDTKGLKCREVDIEAGVASNVHAFASERATATAGISSTVLVSGRPADFRKETARFGSTVSLTD